jgi:phage terminase large subunit-like protein
VHTLGGLFDQVASVLGFMLYPWQRQVADTALEVDPDTRALRYRTVGVSVARQNGKTLLVLIRIALELIRPNRIVAYTAQDRNYARRQWQQHCSLLMAIPAFAREVRDYVKANGQETLVMRNGSMYLILTPNEDAARSLTVDLAVVDEAYSQRSMSIVGAITPTMVTRPSAQLWVLSNAGTHTSVLFRHYTDRGREAVDDPRSSLAWFEWTTADHAELFDHNAWADANPALGLPGGPLVRALEAELLDGGEDTFRREHLNQWHDDGAYGGIDPVAWAGCYDQRTVPAGRLVLSLDITPERDNGTLCVCGEAGDGRTALEVVEATGDLQGLVARTIEVALRHDARVVIDRPSPAGACVPALARAGVAVTQLPLTEVVRACAGFIDAVAVCALAHPGDPRLTDAVVGATKRRVGDGWVWDRRSGSDITALTAATLARWGVVAAPEELTPTVW